MASMKRWTVSCVLGGKDELTAFEVLLPLYGIEYCWNVLCVTSSSSIYV
jgi:hypothetical protein